MASASKLAARVHAWRRVPGVVPLDPIASYAEVRRRVPSPPQKKGTALPPPLAAALERYARATDDGAPLSLATEAAAASILTSAAPFDAHERASALLELWIAREGPAFAVRAMVAAGETAFVHQHGVFQVLEQAPHDFFARGFVGAWRRLRELLTQVAEAGYADARDAARTLREQGREVVRCALAYTFPLEPWGQEDALGASGPIVDAETRLPRHHLVALVSSIDQAEALRHLLAIDRELPTLAFTHHHVATALDRFGDRAPELATVLSHGVASDQRLELAELLTATAGAPAARALVQLVGPDARLSKAAGAALERDPENAVGPIAAALASSPRRAKYFAPILAAIAARAPSVLAERSATLASAERAALGPWLGEEAPSAVRQPSARRATKAAAWLDEGRQYRPTVGGEPMSPAALEELIGALRTARPGRVPAVVANAIASSEPASLAAFASALVDAWVKARSPGEDAWVLGAFAALEGDRAARRLALLARSAAKVVATRRLMLSALEALAELGSDAALVELEKLTISTGELQDTAESYVEKELGRRGLDREDLLDRMVPTCGLASGTQIALDFGPRSFRVVFDDAMVPSLVDADGARLKSLPRPTKKDDPAKAEAAREAWTDMREQLRGVLQSESKRLESAMLERRRWTLESFKGAVVDHPVLGRLARRLVWASYEGAGAHTFRVAEDGSFADGRDEATQIEGSIGIPHPVDVPADERAAWATVLHDYALAQPFAQIGRAFHVVTDEEKAQRRMRRFDGHKLPKRAPFVLEAKGWRRVEEWTPFALVRTLPSSDAEATLDLSPEDDGVRLVSVGLDEGQLGALDPIAFSELVADLERAAI